MRRSIGGPQRRRAGLLTGTSAGFTASYDAADTTSSIHNPARGGPLTTSYAGTSQTRRTAAGSTRYTNLLTGLTADSSTGRYTRLPTGQLLAQPPDSNPANTRYYVFDRLGSVVAQLGADGTTVAARYYYDPYGNITHRAGSANTANPYLFTGGYFDTTTGLYKLGLRYYDPNDSIRSRHSRSSTTCPSSTSFTVTGRLAMAHLHGHPAVVHQTQPPPRRASPAQSITDLGGPRRSLCSGSACPPRRCAPRRCARRRAWRRTGPRRRPPGNAGHFAQRRTRRAHSDR